MKKLPRGIVIAHPDLEKSGWFTNRELLFNRRDNIIPGDQGSFYTPFGRCEPLGRGRPPQWIREHMRGIIEIARYDET